MQNCEKSVIILISSTISLFPYAEKRKPSKRETAESVSGPDFESATFRLQVTNFVA